MHTYIRAMIICDTWYSNTSGCYRDMCSRCDGSVSFNIRFVSVSIKHIPSIEHVKRFQIWSRIHSEFSPLIQRHKSSHWCISATLPPKFPVHFVFLDESEHTCTGWGKNSVMKRDRTFPEHQNCKVWGCPWTHLSKSVLLTHTIQTPNSLQERCLWLWLLICVCMHIYVWINGFLNF